MDSKANSKQSRFAHLEASFIFFDCRAGGLLYIGQDQDSLGGGFNVRQSWGGEITQFNIWSWALEEYYIENMAECRSDLFGDILKWDETQYILGKVGQLKFIRINHHLIF